MSWPVPDARCPQALKRPAADGGWSRHGAAGVVRGQAVPELMGLDAKCRRAPGAHAYSHWMSGRQGTPLAWGFACPTKTKTPYRKRAGFGKLRLRSSSRCMTRPSACTSFAPPWSSSISRRSLARRPGRQGPRRSTTVLPAVLPTRPNCARSSRATYQCRSSVSRRIDHGNAVSALRQQALTHELARELQPRHERLVEHARSASVTVNACKSWIPLTEKCRKGAANTGRSAKVPVNFAALL
ncbi:hypothetical protein SAMN05192589_12238 [Paracidovorax valerianellae]|uniref:Uncharacterized protein n=1 Tax=Paracidovorax valerianellae TaxID=187868 RepID=A0A1G7EA01_9BURK|nr:hypothetical protein SAMN05192589_12238 [Paracidovorax valerianellae]